MPQDTNLRRPLLDYNNKKMAVQGVEPQSLDSTSSNVLAVAPYRPLHHRFVYLLIHHNLNYIYGFPCSLCRHYKMNSFARTLKHTQILEFDTPCPIALTKIYRPNRPISALLKTPPPPTPTSVLKTPPPPTAVLKVPLPTTSVPAIPLPVILEYHCLQH